MRLSSSVAMSYEKTYVTRTYIYGSGSDIRCFRDQTSSQNVDVDQEIESFMGTRDERFTLRSMSTYLKLAKLVSDKSTLTLV